MNPITNTKNQNLMNIRELSLGYTGTVSSWHRQYKDSAWIFIGGLNFDLTEGDIICVFSQYGEVVNINLVRDKKTGVSKGFAFLCYEDQRSTVLATDNLNGIRLAGRTIRVDHVEKYKVPTDGTVNVGTGKKKKRKVDDTTDADAVSAFVREHGCGPEVMKQLKKIETESHKSKQFDEYRQLDGAHARSHEESRHRSESGRRRDTPNFEYPSSARNPSPSSHHRLPSSSHKHKTEKLDELPVTKIKESPPSPSRKRNSPLSSRRRNSPVSSPHKSSSPTSLRRNSLASPTRRRNSPTSIRRRSSTPSPPRRRSPPPSPPRKRNESHPSPPRRRARYSRSPPRIKQESPGPNYDRHTSHRTKESNNRAFHSRLDRRS